VIPQSTTLVVVVFGADALGRPISAMAHRPELVAALAGCGVDDPITPELAATVLGHRDGGLQGVPPQARTVVAITKAYRAGRGPLVADLTERLTRHPDVERVAVLPEPESLRAR
jgi:probable selenium-dependent hydroxylase accessory protein YqeC